jgi:hypothetical protein
MTHARRVPCPTAAGDPVVTNLTLGGLATPPAETNPFSLTGAAGGA